MDPFLIYTHTHTHSTHTQSISIEYTMASAANQHKTQRTHVCSDREGTMKRKLDSRVFEPAEKKHCRECLNTNLVSVKDIGSAVKTLLGGTCNQCGLLWADAKEDTRQDHLDGDIKSSIAHVGGSLHAKLKTAKFAEKNLEAAAYELYYFKHFESGSVKKRLNLLPERKQKLYRKQAKKIIAEDMSLFDDTFMRGSDTDDRPLADFSSVPSCLYPAGSANIAVDFCEMSTTQGTLGYIEQFMKDEKTTHDTYQVSTPLLTSNWGNDRYTCYVCLDELKFDFFSEDVPTGIDSKVCSCSSHVDGTYPEADSPPTYQPPISEEMQKMASLISVDLPQETPAQTAVKTNRGDNEVFLYLCNAMFSGYVIHTGCCGVARK
jgi:hypothetical protein